MQDRDFVEVAAEVAEALGAGWVAEADGRDWGEVRSTRAHLRHEDGRELYLRLGGYRNEGRVAVLGSYGYEDGTARCRGYSLGVEPVAPITVRADRGAVVIAREIERRLLPEYEVRLAEVQRRADEHRRDREVARSYGERVAAALGVSVQMEPEGHEARIWKFWGGAGESGSSVRGRISSSYASLELRVSPEQAVRIAELLAELS